MEYLCSGFSFIYSFENFINCSNKKETKNEKRDLNKTYNERYKIRDNNQPATLKSEKIPN